MSRQRVKRSDPQLYPFAQEFFLSHGHLSMFSPILGLDCAVDSSVHRLDDLAWYLATLFAFAGYPCWMLVAGLLRKRTGPLVGMLLVITAVLAMPATNTGLLLDGPVPDGALVFNPADAVCVGRLLERK